MAVKKPGCWGELSCDTIRTSLHCANLVSAAPEVNFCTYLYCQTGKWSLSPQIFHQHDSWSSQIWPSVWTRNFPPWWRVIYRWVSRLEMKAEHRSSSCLIMPTAWLCLNFVPESPTTFHYQPSVPHVKHFFFQNRLRHSDFTQINLAAFQTCLEHKLWENPAVNDEETPHNCLVLLTRVLCCIYSQTCTTWLLAVSLTIRFMMVYSWKTGWQGSSKLQGTELSKPKSVTVGWKGARAITGGLAWNPWTVKTSRYRRRQTEQCEFQFFAPF
jgi:hypothetical protein